MIGLALAGIGCEPVPRQTTQSRPETQEVVTAPPPAVPVKRPAPKLARAPLPHELGGKMLLAHYMPWYVSRPVRGRWGSHWTGHHKEHNPDENGADGLPDIWSHYHPLVGLYDSTDPAVLECHLLQMRLAGIDGVVADWYGIADVADYPEVHEATRALFDAAGRFGMPFVICFEDRSVKLMVEWGRLQPGDITSHLAETFRWMQEAWFSKSQYLKIGGRPLVLNFGPMYIREPAPWAAAMRELPSPPLLFGLHHLWRQAGADGGFTWVHLDPWDGSPDDRQIRNRIGEVFTYFSTNVDEVIVSAFPGFNDVYTHETHRELAHRDGRTLREILEVAMQGPWPIVQLVTWNDYGEGTMIEPTHEFGYSFLEIIQDARREESGGAFAFTAEDLRLPARLYALRKRAGLDAVELDRIAGYLNAGACGKARAALALMESM